MSDQRLNVDSTGNGDADSEHNRLLRMLANKLEGRGLDCRLVAYPVDSEHIGAVVVTNPAAPERGEARIARDGCVEWGYAGNLDDAGASKILDEITIALRAADPGSGRYGPGTELGRTEQQQLAFLNTHWGRKYSFAAPELPGGPWTATAKFGPPEFIEAPLASVLLEKIRSHYQTTKPGGDER